LAKSGFLKRVYELYTSDLNQSVIDKLIKKEAPEVYNFYKKTMPPADTSKNKFIRSIMFVKNIFVAFLLKLAPLRRIFYTAALLFFVYGILLPNTNYIILSFIMLNLLLAFELADKISAKDELELARSIQMSFMPQKPPEVKDFDIACSTEAARQVGGDYYNFIKSKNENDRTYLIIGDISGKGMAAALYMVQVHAIIHHLFETHEELKKILNELNKSMRSIFKSNTFFTVTLASFGCGNEIKICRAGHMPLLYYSAREKRIIDIIPNGLAVGMNDKGIFEKTLEEKSINTSSGDILVFYTDGITETMNESMKPYGEENLKEVILKNAETSAAVIHKEVMESIATYIGSTPQSDDMTLIVLRAL